MKTSPYIFCCIAALASMAHTAVRADGMVPETSIVIVHEADGEASLRVRNDDSRVALLLVDLQDIPEDEEPLLFLTQPAWRVEAGKEQVVRFILRTDIPLTTQRLKRVVFEGVPAVLEADGEPSRVGVSIRQNLPVLIHPRGLDFERTPWTRLHWRVLDDALQVHNPSPYVVRLAQELVLQPSGQQVRLPRGYILPGEALRVALEQGIHAPVERVRLFPARVYGAATQFYEASLRQPDH